MRSLFLCLSVLFPALAAHAVPSLVQRVNEHVYMVSDDADSWGANWSLDITHQVSSTYQAKKVLDLSDLPPAVWEATTSVRLSVQLCVRDYSFHDLPRANGLDETLQFVINGKVHEYPTSGGAPVYLEPIGGMGWYDVSIPKADVVRGVNEIIVRKAPGKPQDPQAGSDDYLYLAIDLTRKRGNSSVTFDGTTWTRDKLTIPGGNGEYMVRLYLITGTTHTRATWRPGQTPAYEDPAGLVLYAGARGVKATAAGLSLSPGQLARVEWSATAFDAAEPMQVTVQARGPAHLQWLDPTSKAVADPAIDGASGTLPAGRALKPSGLLIMAQGQPVTVQAVTIEGSQTYHPEPPRVNIAPLIAAAPAVPPARPVCSTGATGITLTGGHLQAIFERAGTLRLRSLRNLIHKSEMLRARPEQVPLFCVEVNNVRYAGSRDFEATDLQPVTNGFVATLRGPLSHEAGGLPPRALQATLTVVIGNDGLRMGMELTNVGTAPVDFKLAFPVLAGLAVSPHPPDDYYFFPSGGGIFSATPAVIRRGYGDYEAMYQMMDLFSPALGCGLSLRALDDQGWHKVLALRKHVPDKGEANYEHLTMNVKDDYRWKTPLDAVAGTSLAFEYLRRTRATQSEAAPAVAGHAASLSKTATFAPADCLLTVHYGDWHTPMAAYAEWAHRVWQFRPFPSRLKHIRNMDCPGWAQNILFRDGKYRTDFITARTDCVELMSWWEWSPLGPFMTPLDQLDKVLTPAQIKEWQPYFVKDPVTGQKMWNNQPGDYKGYNERFGGLPAFRKAIETYQKRGVLVTLYTDPFRLDENCDTGRAHGKQWTVVLPDGKPSTSYEVYNPCHNLAEVRQWAAETMGRVMRETGADGIRLDEYGHRGWACYSEAHDHTFQEPGITQWNKAVAEACRLIHAEMDKVRPDLVLTTEHPGYDYLMQYLEGCITYDLSVVASPLRPVECNLQRFYFPECKAYELDHRTNDPQSRKTFWNTVESFERDKPIAMASILDENEDVYQGRDNTPLVPTLQPLLYANRFRGGGKTMIHLYNAMGHTFEGPVLAVAADAGGSGPVHVIELLHGAELPVIDGRVSLYIDRDDVACVAILPRLLQVDGQGHVRIGDGKGGQLVLVNEKGEGLVTQEATGSEAALDLTRLPVGTKPACLKLLRDKQMVDTMQWP